MTTRARGRTASRTSSRSASRTATPFSDRFSNRPTGLGALIALILAGLLTGLLGGVLFGVAPASAKEPGETALAIKASAHKGVYLDDREADAEPYADTVVYRGTLTTVDDDEPVVGATLVLELRPDSTGEWTEVNTAETNDNGRAELVMPVVENGRYRFSYAGDDTYTGSVSGKERLKVMRDLNARLKEVGKKSYLRGNINPGWDERKVVWQRKTCKKCMWKQVAHKQSSANGAWKFRAQFPKKVGKSFFFRARIKGTEDYIASVSGTLRTFVTPARESRRTTVG